MMRDSLVVGLAIQLCLRGSKWPRPTLEKAISAAHQSEAVKKQQAVVRGAENLATNIDNIQ